MRQMQFIAALLIIACSACSTVTISPAKDVRIASDPTYQDSKSFFLWGLVGEHDVDVKQICDGRDPVQMQSQETFTDGLLTIITLGIYAP